MNQKCFYYIYIFIAIILIKLTNHINTSDFIFDGCDESFIDSCENDTSNEIAIKCSSDNLTTIPQLNINNANASYLYRFSLTGQQNLSSIADYSFANLNYTSIDLSNNGINAITQNSFTNASIVFLILKNNLISYVHLNAFNSSMLTLEYLDLSGNLLVKLPQLNYLQFLEYLNLSYNLLEDENDKMSTQDVVKIPRMIETLILANNRFKKISKDMLSNLKNMFQLYLQSNFIEIIDDYAFMGNSELEIISLSKNAISSLPIRALTHTPSLKTVFLDLQNINNKSLKLNDYAFEMLDNETEVVFSKNTLELSDKTFLKSMNSSFFKTITLQLNDVIFKNYDQCTYYKLFNIRSVNYKINNNVCDCNLQILAKHFTNVDLKCKETIDKCDIDLLNSIKTKCFNKLLKDSPLNSINKNKVIINLVVVNWIFIILVN